VHPNDAGYEIMASAIDPSSFSTHGPERTAPRELRVQACPSEHARSISPGRSRGASVAS
jgi:hypothetical protein